jgi:hypothetical protein
MLVMNWTGQKCVYFQHIVYWYERESEEAGFGNGFISVCLARR